MKISIIISILARPNTLALVPWSGENAKDFFCYRNGLVSNAVGECKKEVLTPDDGELIGSWLLTEYVHYFLYVRTNLNLSISILVLVFITLMLTFFIYYNSLYLFLLG